MTDYLFGIDSEILKATDSRDVNESLLQSVFLPEKTEGRERESKHATTPGQEQTGQSPSHHRDPDPGYTRKWVHPHLCPLGGVVWSSLCPSEELAC